MDTAGLRETEDEVEKMGMEASLRLARESDLIYLVLDINESVGEKVKGIFSEDSLERIRLIFKLSQI